MHKHKIMIHVFSFKLQKIKVYFRPSSWVGGPHLVQGSQLCNKTRKNILNDSKLIKLYKIILYKLLIRIRGAV